MLISRCRFQFHLSTAIVTMLAASTVVFLNSQPRYELIRLTAYSVRPVSISEAMEINERRNNGNYFAYLLRIRHYGWPFPFCERMNLVGACNWKWVDADESFWGNPWGSYWLDNGKMHLVWDLLICVVITLFLGTVFQVFVSSRQKHSGGTPLVRDRMKK